MKINSSMKPSIAFFSTCFAGWLVLLLAAGATSAQTLTLTGVEPAAGAPQDRVQLRGQGFDRPAASYFAWVAGGDRGSVLDIKGKSSSARLDAVVGDLHAAVEGPVVLWRGRRSAVPAFTVGGGRFRVRDAFLFEPAEAARGPSFAAAAGTAPGSAGRLVDGAIHLDLSGLTLGPPVAASGRQAGEEGEDTAEEPGKGSGGDTGGDTDGGSGEGASIAVEGTGESCGEPGGFTVRGFGVGFRIECRQQPCQGEPAALLAAAFQGVLGESGVRVAVEGSTVVLSRDRPLCGAAFNVTVSPASAR